VITPDQALAMAQQILAATLADKSEADRRGGSPQCDAAVDEATTLVRLVVDTQ
jgi:hypothetical protein